MVKKCLYCGKEFSVHNYRKDIAKYCSPECYSKDMKGKTRTTLEHRKQKKKEQDRGHIFY